MTASALPVGVFPGDVEGPSKLDSGARAAATAWLAGPAAELELPPLEVVLLLELLPPELLPLELLPPELLLPHPATTAATTASELSPRNLNLRL